MYSMISVFLFSSLHAVLEETSGDGVGRLFEATGAEALINNSFSLVRYRQMSVTDCA